MEWDHVKILGRNYLEEDTLWLCSSASEVSFYSTGADECVFEFAYGTKVNDDSQPWYMVFVDDEMMMRSSCVPENGNAVIRLDKNRINKIRLIKISEAQQSILGIRGIRAGQITPLPYKERRIAFYGDSLTCAYGVEGQLEQPFTTATENVLKGYAFLTAEKLNADMSILASSGHGIISGYTADPNVINDKRLVPDYFDRIAFSSQKTDKGTDVTTVPYDNGLFDPQDIVINLGSNDMSYCKEDQEKIAVFQKGFTAFLRKVRQSYPDARITCILGVIGDTLNKAEEAAAETLNRDIGKQPVRFIAIPHQNAQKDGVGSQWHPSAITHQKMADMLTEVLR